MRYLRALGLYAVLTVALTWPFAANLRVMDAGDSAFFAWEIGWTVHALKTDPAQLLTLREMVPSGPASHSTVMKLSVGPPPSRRL